MFRIQSNVDIGWGMRLSSVLNVQTGRPWWRLGFLTTPYTFNPITITAEHGDHLRYPDQAILDLGLQKTIDLGKGVDFDIALQVLNVFNEDAAEYWADWSLTPEQELEGTWWVSPRRLQVKFKLAF
jgi:hypothetical protein